MAELFSVGDSVTWQTPEDRNHWRNEYDRLVDIFGKGPFTVEELRPLPRNNRQGLVLSKDGKVIVSQGNPYPFSSTWVKKA